MSAMPAELQAHLRFPEDLFIAQNQSYRLYHLPATDFTCCWTICTASYV